MHLDDEGETNKRERAKKNVREIRAMRSAVIVFHGPWPTRPSPRARDWGLERCGLGVPRQPRKQNPFPKKIKLITVNSVDRLGMRHAAGQVWPLELELGTRTALLGTWELATSVLSVRCTVRGGGGIF